jgi:uncharacterized membrane protein YphA (DoxX/SURF4 family)
MKNAAIKIGVVTLLRIAVGWHLFYEGVSKIADPEWTAARFLAGTSGFLSGFYHWLADAPQLMRAVDLLNMYGLALIGLGLLLGVLVRYASIAGIVLLGLYYFAYPPFGPSLMVQPEGSVFVVNRILIEALILCVFIFLDDTGPGLGRFVNMRRAAKPDGPDIEAGGGNRREALKNLLPVPVLGLLWGTSRSGRQYGADVVSGATIKVGAVELNELKGALPKGRIGPHEISRLVMGGNMIGGWAHARDLIYVSSLFKAYNTEEKVFETLQLAEQAGINTINIGFPSNRLMQKYKMVTGSKIKVISQVGPSKKKNDYYANINRAIDFGVDVVQIQGNWCDWLVRDGYIDTIGEMMDKIRSQGYTAGLAAHTVDSLIACEEQGIIPDYYMKTMHHDQYWSAHPLENRVPYEVDGKQYQDHDRFHNNMFCLFPDRTIEFVQRAKVPVMGFKVLAAGAIQPEDGFRWAFENGADFICVGMFDFQIVKDVNIAIDTLAGLTNRRRAWFG